MDMIRKLSEVAWVKKQERRENSSNLHSGVCHSGVGEHNRQNLSMTLNMSQGAGVYGVVGSLKESCGAPLY